MICGADAPSAAHTHTRGDVAGRGSVTDWALDFQSQKYGHPARNATTKCEIAARRIRLTFLVKMRTPGTIIAIGGNEAKSGGKESILGEFVRCSGGPEARIAIIPSASSDPAARAARYATVFTRLGAGSVVAIHAERGAVTRDDLQLLTNATGIFVTGGDQQRLMAHLRATGCDAAILDAVRRGAVYAGTSAGAAALSEVMIAGSRGNAVRIGTGLGLLRDVIIDQHFDVRDRLPRLTHAARTHNLTGLGIDENTAIVFEPDGRRRVVGEGRVTVVRADGSTASLT
jgi:cyanophycinase